MASMTDEKAVIETAKALLAMAQRIERIRDAYKPRSLPGFTKHSARRSLHAAQDALEDAARQMEADIGLCAADHAERRRLGFTACYRCHRNFD